MADKKNAASSMSDLRKLSVEDLNKKLLATENDLLTARKSLAANELANPHAVKKMRKQIAQIKTLITEKNNSESNSNNEKGAK